MKLEWQELVAKFAPTRVRSELMNLRALQPGAYVGIVKSKSDNGRTTNFILLNTDRSAKLDWVLNKDATFESRLVEVYRVDEAKWESKVSEFDTPGLPPWGP